MMSRKVLVTLWGICLVGLSLGQHGDSTSGINPVYIPEEVLAAASEPEPVSVAEPNLGALLGIGALAGSPGLLSNIRGRSITGGGLPQTLPDVSSLCGSNSDALSNLLVYQYLSGSIPQGTPGLPGIPNAGGANPAAAAAIAANPNLKALLNGEVPGTTSTAISTTVTTRVITMEASTKFQTSTTSYVTTVTQTTTTVLPIIFRGSKITTTITDKTTEVLTATEFKTLSSVIAPSIVQTLPVEITLLHKSTFGPDGQYTLDKITQGATKVIEKPISTKNVNFDSHGLDLSGIDLAGIDLSQIDLSSLSGAKNDDMLRSLTALLDQYKSDQRPDDRGRGRERERERERPRWPSRNEESRYRFRDRRPSEPPADDPPKFNVLRGFTYSDRPDRPDRTSPRKSPPRNDGAGTASLSTRYSKFRKKEPVKNNNVGPQKSDRESEPFSATTSRRTVSPAEDRRPSPPRSRFQKERPSRNAGVRRNRQVEAERRRTGRRLHREKPERKPTVNHIPTQNNRKGNFDIKTTVLTMYMTGPRPGQTISIARTVTLRNLQSNRLKREASIEPSPMAKKMEATRSIPSPSSVSPSDVINLLKSLDKSQVRGMLDSLHKWVDFYIDSVLDEPEKVALLSNKFMHAANEIPELHSSYKEPQKVSTYSSGTTLLPSLPNTITKEPSNNSSNSENLCPKPITLTETIYRTIYSKET